MFDFISEYLGLIVAAIFLAPIVTAHGYFYDMFTPENRTKYLLWWSMVMKGIGFVAALIVITLAPVVVYAGFANWRNNTNTAAMDAMTLIFISGLFTVAVGHLIGFPWTTYRMFRPQHA